MKAYKLELLIIDHDGIGADGVKSTIENTRFPNDCINPTVGRVTEADIGEWRDDHPLNLKDTFAAEYERLFEKRRPVDPDLDVTPLDYEPQAYRDVDDRGMPAVATPGLKLLPRPKMIKTNTPRPKHSDPEIIAMAAKKLAPDVLDWSKSDLEVDFDEDGIAELLVEALSWGTNGYTIAKNLEDDFCPDAELVAILDGADHLIYRAYEEACRAWLPTSGLQEPSVGTIVGPSKPGIGNGEVVKHYPGGRACVCYPGLGHVKKGEGTISSIINWEDLTPPEAP